MRIDRVRVVVAPRLFRAPVLRRFDGYTLPGTILLRRPPRADGPDDLLTHELCHVWQLQHHPLRMPLSFLVRPYSRNPYELEARWAARASRGAAAPDEGPGGAPSAALPLAGQGP